MKKKPTRKIRRPLKTWQFTYYHSAPLAQMHATTGEMTPSEAGQYLKDTVDEMRAILGKARRYPRVQEPNWLTDAIKRGLAKQKRELE